MGMRLLGMSLMKKFKRRMMAPQPRIGNDQLRMMMMREVQIKDMKELEWEVHPFYGRLLLL